MVKIAAPILTPQEIDRFTELHKFQRLHSPRRHQNWHTAEHYLRYITKSILQFVMWNPQGRSLFVNLPGGQAMSQQEVDQEVGRAMDTIKTWGLKCSINGWRQWRNTWIAEVLVAW